MELDSPELERLMIYEQSGEQNSKKEKKMLRKTLLLISVLFVTFTICINTKTYAGKQECTIEGTVTDYNGVPISQAEVKVCDNVVYTDANGNYIVYVTPGVYNVNVSKNGYHTRIREKIYVDEEQNASNINFTLYLSSGPPEWNVLQYN